jgi:hypothetical protein
MTNSGGRKGLPTATPFSPLLMIIILIKMLTFVFFGIFYSLEVPKPIVWNPSGKRILRGLYRTKSGRLCNADINASYNILKKEFPNAFETGDREVLVDPFG